jgi:hypothetical protein
MPRRTDSLTQAQGEAMHRHADGWIALNRREHSISTDSGKIKVVAWRRGENSYWISSRLEKSSTNEMMRSASPAT